MRVMKLGGLWLASVVLTVSGCVTVPNVRSCQVAGVLAAGMICAESQTGITSDMDLQQTIDFLEPQPERPDPANTAVTLPARAGAVCRSTDDERRMKETLEKLCRQMGTKCMPELRAAISLFR